jgi:hypothetical protein
MKLKWTHFIKDELFSFFLEAPCIFLTRHFLTSAVVGYQLNWSKEWEYSSADHPSGWELQDFKPHWSEMVNTVCCFKIHGARGLAMEV